MSITQRFLNLFNTKPRKKQTVRPARQPSPQDNTTLVATTILSADFDEGATKNPSQSSKSDTYSHSHSSYSGGYDSSSSSSSSDSSGGGCD